MCVRGQGTRAVQKMESRSKSKRGNALLMFKDLLLIILGVATCYAFYFLKDYRNKKEIKKQERLNRIK